MKLILKQHLSGVNGVFAIGDTIEVGEEQAVAFIEKEIAGFKTDKELKAFMKKVGDIKKAKAEKEAEARAVLEGERLQAELNTLYTEVVKKEAELNGVVLSEEETLEAFEAIAKRDAVKGK